MLRIEPERLIKQRDCLGVRIGGVGARDERSDLLTKLADPALGFFESSSFLNPLLERRHKFERARVLRFNLERLVESFPYIVQRAAGQRSLGRDQLLRDCRRSRGALRLYALSLDTRRLDARRLDSRRFDPRRFDPLRLDPRRFDPRRFDPRCLDARRFDPRRFDPFRFDTRCLDPRRLDARRFERRFDLRRLDTRRFSAFDLFLLLDFYFASDRLGLHRPSAELEGLQHLNRCRRHSAAVVLREPLQHLPGRVRASRMSPAKDNVELSDRLQADAWQRAAHRLLDFGRELCPARGGVVRDDDLALLSERPLARCLFRRVVEDVFVDVVVELVDRDQPVFVTIGGPGAQPFDHVVRKQ